MFRRKKESFIKKILTHQITLTIIGLAIIIAISFPLARNVSQQYQSNQQITNLQKEIKTLEKQNSQMNNLISFLQSDEYIQEKARLDLNYKSPGENVAVINGQDGQDIGATTSGDAIAQPTYAVNQVAVQKNESEPGNPVKWWEYFMD